MRRSGMVVALVLSLVACAGPEPILKANSQVQLYGKDLAEREAAVCGVKAERAGLQHGTNRLGNVGSGSVLGVIVGAAVGASSGIVGGLPGVTIGAAAGAALGGVLGALGGSYRPVTPQQDYADFVERCLREKGYETEGWQ